MTRRVEYVSIWSHSSIESFSSNDTEDDSSKTKALGRLISAIGGLGLFAWLWKPRMADEDDFVLGVVKELWRGGKIATDVSASIP